MRLTRVEQETIILWNEGESTVEVYTYNEKFKAQFAEFAGQYPDKVKRSMIDADGALHAALPKSEVRVLFRRPRSEKQQQVSMENARRFRERLQNAPSAEP